METTEKTKVGMSSKKIAILEILLDAMDNPAEYISRFLVGNGGE